MQFNILLAEMIFKCNLPMLELVPPMNANKFIIKDQMF